MAWSLELAGAESLGAILVGPPTADALVPQLEEPGHFVPARRRAILIPMPSPCDQCHSAIRILIKLIEDDRLLDSARLSSGPQPCRLYAFPQAPPGMKFDIRVQGLNKPIKVSLIEGPNELPNRVDHLSHVSGSRTAVKSKQVGGRREGGEGSALRA